jgi:chondroitin sulfate synthase
MQNIFYHSYNGNQSFKHELLSSDVLDATSLHPVKQADNQYRLHNFFNLRKIIDLRQKKLLHLREIHNLDQDILKISKLNKNHTSILKNRLILIHSFIANKPKKNRRYRHDFHYFSRYIYSSKNMSPKRGAEGHWKNAIKDATRQYVDLCKKTIKKNYDGIDVTDVVYGYKRHDPLLGMEYIIDTVLDYRKGMANKTKIRRHDYLRQTYTSMFFREDNYFDSMFHHRDDFSNESMVQYDTKNNIFIKNLVNFILPKPNNDILFKKNNFFVDPQHKISFQIDSKINNKYIHFIVPLSGRFDTFKKFIKNFENVCLKTSENVKLALILFIDEQLKEDENLFSEVNSITNGLKNKYFNENLNLVKVKGNFSRSIACELGASLYSSKSLLLFIDIDMLFRREILLRVRLNTIEGKQVYFPIVFKQYDPSQISRDNSIFNRNRSKLENHATKDHFSYNSETGFWIEFGYGMVSTYSSDLNSVGGYNTKIIGWGKEDVDLYDKFVKSNITIFRTVDPSLVHLFHEIFCEKNIKASDQEKMCIGSKAETEVSQGTLANIFYEHKLYLKSFVEHNETTVNTLN